MSGPAAILRAALVGIGRLGVSDVTTPESEGINSKIVVVDPSKGRGFRRAALHVDKSETITISQALHRVAFFLQLSNLFPMPWWGNKSKDSAEQQKETPKNESFDANKLPAPERLPKALQRIVDSADEDSGFFDGITEG